MRKAKPQRKIRIQASGPFFELDFTVPERKAPAELKRIKKYLLAAIAPTVQAAKENSSRHKRMVWRRHRYVPVYSRDFKFVAADHKIQPTKIITTICQ